MTLIYIAIVEDGGMNYGLASRPSRVIEAVIPSIPLHELNLPECSGGASIPDTILVRVEHSVGFCPPTW